jgi:hypothetical protein
MSRELTEKQVKIAEKWIETGWEDGYTNVPDKEALCIIRYIHNCSKEYAEFVLAIEHGEIQGDVVIG